MNVAFKIVNIDFNERNIIIVNVQNRQSDKVDFALLDSYLQEKPFTSFSSEDYSYLKQLVQNLSLKQSHSHVKESSLFLFLAFLFCGFLIVSNLTASKITLLGGYNITAAMLFFPLTYIVGDIINEVYGFHASRKIIWGGFFVNFIVVIGTYIIVKTPPSPHFLHQKAFETLFDLSLRLFAASSIAYIAGEFVNAVILCKLKVKTSGQLFWLRALGSTSIGAALDTSLFFFIGFIGILPLSMIINIALLEYGLKILYEILILPFTYKMVHWIKKRENIDFYDYDTKFRLFSLKDFS